MAQKLSSDTERVKTLIDAAGFIYCEDSSDKLTIANEASALPKGLTGGWG